MKNREKCAILFLPPDPIHFGRIGCCYHPTAELWSELATLPKPGGFLSSQRTPTLKPNLTSDTVYCFQQPRIPRAADFFFFTVALHDKNPPTKQKIRPETHKKRPARWIFFFSLLTFHLKCACREKVSRKNLILPNPLAICAEICYNTSTRDAGFPVV